jgi:hypothetical protein
LQFQLLKTSYLTGRFFAQDRFHDSSECSAAKAFSHLLQELHHEGDEWAEAIWAGLVGSGFGCGSTGGRGI